LVNGDLCGAEPIGKNMADRILDAPEKLSVAIVCNAVSIFVLRQQHEQLGVLLIRRKTSMPGKWCQIVGSIEVNETAWKAALLEVREERGLELSKLWSGDIC
jgi:dATP pyrophosphohydrolase